MKRTLLIFLLAAGTGMSAQIYRPMPDSNAIWKEFHNAVWAQNPLLMDHYLGGDTLINSTNYVKVYADGYYSASQNYWYGQYEGAMRNDSAARLVYFVPRDSANEVVLYDFNLTPGQPFPMTWINTTNYSPDVVATIDSVLVGSTWRKRYKSASPYTYEFIEGLGSASGLLTWSAFQNQSEVHRVECFYQNDRPAWPDTSVGCASPLGLNAEHTAHSITVSPVPNSGIFTITTSAGGLYDVAIYSATGQLTRTFSIASATSTVNLTGEAEGIYFLHFTNRETGEVSRQKILMAR